MLLSIIIVNYKTYELTSQTLSSVFEQNFPYSYEVILVDNASYDGSIERIAIEFEHFNQLKIIKSDMNGGFAKGNNIGIRQAKGKYILLLNSDTMLDKDVLSRCVFFAKNYKKKTGKTIGALGGKVVLENGMLDHACKRGFPTPEASLYYLLNMDKRNPKKYGAYRALDKPDDKICEVDCLTGAFMLIPQKVIRDVGMLDEDFFMYGEDIDWCFRIKEAGYKIVYYPRVKITHFKGGSSKKRRTKVIFDFHNAMWLFYKKHYFSQYSILVSLLVYIGIWSRYSIAILLNFLK